MKSIGKVILASVILFTGACKKKESTATPVTIGNVTISTSLPAVSTITILSMEDVTATIKSSVSSEGTSALTAVGVCWDTLPAPTTLRLHSNEGAGTGTYQSLLYNLKANTTYYVRAYATNATGTAYGNELNFKTGNAWELLKAGLSMNSLIYTNSTLFSGTGNGIFRSTDEGVSWTQSGLTGITVNALVASGGIMYAGTYGSGLYKSTNGGTSWISLSGLNDYYINYLAVQGATVFASGSNGMNVSVNNGISWTQSNAGFPSPNISYVVYNGTLAFAGTGANGVYVSSNNGGSWTAVNSGLPSNTNVYSLCQTGNNILVSFASGDMYLSSNNGSSWTQINSILGNTIFAFATKNNDVYASRYGTAFISRNNGLLFKETKAGLITPQIFSCIAISNNNVFLGGPYLYRRPL